MLNYYYSSPLDSSAMLELFASISMFVRSRLLRGLAGMRTTGIDLLIMLSS